MAVAAYADPKLRPARGANAIDRRRRSTYAKLRRPKPKEKRFPILQLLSKITPGPNRRRASHALATFPAVDRLRKRFRFLTVGD